MASPIERLNAAGLSLIDGVMHRIYGSRKSSLFERLPNHIVEIGPGAGANFRYYPPGTTVTAIEPSEPMFRRLGRSADDQDITLVIRAEGAEQIGLSDRSVDTVVSTLVLCSVENVAKSLEEIRRILRPGGKFIFLEHVVARPGTITRSFQRLLRAPWRGLFGGCRIDRDIATEIERTGFSSVEIDPFTVSSRLLPVHPHISGVARK